ncbi:MAG TPA: hypothetical protein VNA25_15680 [Phycisphaerae bacterium]|nr:hypothetical protein [Phycisphaerae bacterium]
MAALVDLAESLGFQVRAGPSGESAGRAGGAVVRLRDKQIIFLDAHAPPGDQINVLAAALAERPEIAERFIVPELRELIERARHGADAPK